MSPYELTLILELFALALLLAFAITAFGVMFAGADKPDAVVHGADADGDHADVSSSRARCSRSRACPAWLGVLNRLDPPHLRPGADAAARSSPT